MQERLQDIERLHQEERDHWLQKAEDSSGESSKEAELLLEIEGLTQALQAQLMGEADGSEITQLIQSLEDRLNSSQTELNRIQSVMLELSVEMVELTQKLTEREQRALSEEFRHSGKTSSRSWMRLFRHLNRVFAKQDELEQLLAEQTLNPDRVTG